ncbi:MAG: hypothetical protein CM15mP74_26940 [Halieaceae bacterium]|nr:MAG: hypothetical protein CM15mP74_26940 [Halieaceae bacterium]
MLQSGILAGSVMVSPAVNYAPTEEDKPCFIRLAGSLRRWYIEGLLPGWQIPSKAVRLDAIASRPAEWAGFLAMMQMTCVTRGQG